MLIRLWTLVFAFLLLAPQGALAAAEQIVINKGTNQLAFYQDNRLVKVFPVATGRSASLTPEGEFRVINKIVNPPYYKTNIPGGSPHNPLGPRWLGLSAPGGTYGIHGNNNPHSIGTYASAGCVRMYNDDIIWLFEQVPVGTPVKIINDSTDLATLVEPEEAILTVNGNYIPENCRAIILDDEVMIALRPIAEFLGYQVTWDNATNQVIVTKLETTMTLQIDQQEISVNGTVIKLARTPILFDNHTYVPLEFFAQFPNLESTWYPNSKQVNFNDHTVFLPNAH